jgi:lichenan operon transcriptional antiterminator
MYSKYRKLLTSLVDSKNDWITAGALSLSTNMSVRSVKTYIGELNSSHESLIRSSKNGYQIDRVRAKELLSSSKKEAPYTPEERIHVILKKMFAYESVDLWNLCENELFVSMETLKKDLGQVRKRLREFDIYIITNKDSIELEGSELDKRKLLSNLLYEEFSENVLSLSSIEEIFPQYDTKYIYNTILELCRHRSFFVNEYSILTMVLDIVISIDRIKNGFILPNKEITKSPDTSEQRVAQNIIQRIEEHFDISYNEFELNAITIIIISSLIKTEVDKIIFEDIEKYIDPGCASLIEPLKAQLANYDFIDIDNAKFMTRFILHINNLLLRLKNQYVRKNPLTEHIKTSCPMIFDCAVALSNIITQKTGYRISEHETAYIALHIGSLLSTLISMRDKVLCTLLFPGYYDYDEKLIAQLTKSFGSSLLIQNVITQAEELRSVDPRVDLVISIGNVPDFYTREFVSINPFMADRDLEAIRTSVERIRQLKKKRRLFERLKQMSSSGIFFRNTDFTNEDDAIRYLSSMMIQNGYAGGSFTEEVLARERSYSTAYGNIAVPHSMQMNAKKTGMAVLINENPIPWGQKMVNVVLMFSIQKETINLFYDIFDNLIVMLLEAANTAKIMKCESYDAFIQTIIDCL